VSTATATIVAKLARRLGLASANAENKPYPVGGGALPAGTGRRTLTIAFTAQARAALARLPGVRLTVVVRSTDTYSRRSATYKLLATPHR
jgi:hypothetical protein